jgi:hypothetical protein
MWNITRSNSGQIRTTPIIALFALAVFLFGLVRTTDWLYQKTTDHRVLEPQRIMSGMSQAPNQYRILAPALCLLVDKMLLHDPGHSDHAVVFFSILFAYVAAFALFYVSSRSIPISILASLALLGCFSFGMMWKYRQEFFEVGFVSLTLIAATRIRHVGRMYFVIAMLTVLGSLNRETFIFCIMGVAVHAIGNRIMIQKESGRLHLRGVSILLAIFAICYVGLRWHFGLSHYHSKFWTYQDNLQNILSISSPFNILYLGGGIAFAYLATVALGNKEYSFFILGYAVPMLLIATFISQFSEHRVFYPLMVLFAASITKCPPTQIPRPAEYIKEIHS